MLWRGKNPRRKLLVVSPDTLYVKLLRRDLAALDLEIEVASGVVDALRRAGWDDPERPNRRALPDVILADWKIPYGVYDGLEMLYIVRTNPFFRDCRFILHGAGRNPLYDAPAFLASLPIQADYNLPLAFNPEELQAALTRLLDRE